MPQPRRFPIVDALHGYTQRGNLCLSIHRFLFVLPGVHARFCGTGLYYTTCIFWDDDQDMYIFSMFLVL